MNLMVMLRNWGDRLGIIEVTSSSRKSVPLKVQTRSVTLRELMTEIRSEEIRTLAEKPAEVAAAFEKIFQAAGIAAPAHGWNVDRLSLLLESDELQHLERAAAQHKLLELLGRDGVDVQEVVKDAVARDRALDEYERSARGGLKERLSAAERRIAELETRLRGLEAQRADLQRQTERERREWDEWSERKRAYELKLASTVGYFVGESVISLSEPEEPPHPTTR